MTILDALETENAQALGALAAVTAQRDRLRRYVNRLENLIADSGVFWSASAMDAGFTREQDAAGVLPGDMGDEA